MTSEQSSEWDSTELTPRLLAMTRLVKLLKQQLTKDIPRISENPSLTQVFCQALGKCHVNPQFYYYIVTNQEMRKYLADFLNVEVKLNYTICELQIEGTYVCISVGSGKKISRDLTVACASSLILGHKVRVLILDRYRLNSYLPTLALVPNDVTDPVLPNFFDSPKLSSNDLGEENQNVSKMTQKVFKKNNVHWGPPVSKRLIKDFVLLYNNHSDVSNEESVLKDSAKFSEQGIDLLVEAETEGGYVATLFLETFPIGDYWAETNHHAKEGAIVAGVEFLLKKCPAVSIGNGRIDTKTALTKKIAKEQGSTLNMDNKIYISSISKGYKMLECLGWCKGEGLGMKKTGRLVPILPEGDGLLREMDSRAGVGYGQEQRFNSGYEVISRGEVDALVVNYLHADTVEDLVFGAGFSNYEERLIQQIGYKYNLKNKRIGKSFLVLSRKINISMIIDQLRKCKRKFLYSFGNSYSLCNVHSSSEEPELIHQSIRPTSGFPTYLSEINPKLSVKVVDEELDTKSEVYNAVNYLYTASDNPPRIRKKDYVPSIYRRNIVLPQKDYYTKTNGKKPKSVIEEVRALLRGKEKNGAMSTWMEAQLRKTFGEKLSEDWLIEMEKIGTIRLGSISGNWSQVFPVNNYDINGNVFTVPAIVEDSSTSNSKLNISPKVSKNMQHIATPIMRSDNSVKRSVSSPNEIGPKVNSNEADSISVGKVNKADQNMSIRTSDVTDLQNFFIMLNINSDKILEKVRSQKYHIARAVLLNRAKDDLIVRLVSVQDPEELVLQDGSLAAVQSRYRLSQNMATYYCAGNVNGYPISSCKSGDYLAIYLGQDEGWFRARVMTQLNMKASVTIRLLDTWMLKLVAGDFKVYQLENQFKELPSQAVTTKFDIFDKKWLTELILSGNKLLRAKLVDCGDGQELIFRNNGKKVAVVYTETEGK